MPEVYSYNGRIAIIDLSKQRVRTLELKENVLRMFIGGTGLGAYLFLDLIRNKYPEPFSEENPLIFMTGPLTGTIAPASGRHAVISRSPLTNIFGEATSGGFFGVELKKTGYDGVVFLGSSERPVYVFIEKGEISFHDARDLWGLGTYETMQSIRKDLGKNVKVACIGPAGENLVRYSAIMNDDGRAAARTGLGAVMGSKKLKAVAVLGEKEISVCSEEFFEYSRELSRTLAESISAMTLKELGTAGYFEVGYEFGDIPGKYFMSLDFDPETLSGTRLNELFHVTPKACFACPIGCGREIKLDSLVVHGPEYETLAALGSLNLIMNMDIVVRANHMCNDLGLDTISTGVTIAFLNYLVEKEIISRKDANISWGSGEGLLRIIRMIAHREGIGNLLAEGVKRMAEKLGVDREEAAHVKGLEIPMHDPRAFFSMALVYMTSNRGACHLRGDSYIVDMGVLEDENFNLRLGEPTNLVDRVPVVIGIQNLREIFNSLLICIFTHFDSEKISKLLRLATGWDITPRELYVTGERIFNLKRSINNLFGITRKDDYLPKITTKPYTSGPIQGQTPENQLEEALRKYYQMRGWDWETGKPTRKKLHEVGLGDVADILWR